MAIYVDNLTPCIPNENWRYHESCHLFSDSDNVASQVSELIGFACKINLKLDWLQKDPKLPHFDLNKNMRQKAVEGGAVTCNRNKVKETMLNNLKKEKRDAVV